MRFAHAESPEIQLFSCSRRLLMSSLNSCDDMYFFKKERDDRYNSFRNLVWPTGGSRAWSVPLDAPVFALDHSMRAGPIYGMHSSNSYLKYVNSRYPM